MGPDADSDRDTRDARLIAARSLRSLRAATRHVCCAKIQIREQCEHDHDQEADSVASARQVGG